MHEVESMRFLELLVKASPAETARVTARYREEFGRYMGQPSPA